MQFLFVQYMFILFGPQPKVCFGFSVPLSLTPLIQSLNISGPWSGPETAFGPFARDGLGLFPIRLKTYVIKMYSISFRSGLKECLCWTKAANKCVVPEIGPRNCNCEKVNYLDKDCKLQYFHDFYILLLCPALLIPG